VAVLVAAVLDIPVPVFAARGGGYFGASFSGGCGDVQGAV